MARRKSNNSISRKEEIVGLLLITLAILIFISLISYNADEQPGNITGQRVENKLGVAGAYLSYYLIEYGIGYPSFVIPVIILLLGWNIVRSNPARGTLRAIAYLFAFALYTSVILAIPQVTTEGGSRYGFTLSGLIGGLLAQMLFNYLGVAGSIVVLLSLIMITVIGATNIRISGVVDSIHAMFAVLSDAWERRRQQWRATQAKRSQQKRGKASVPQRDASQRDERIRDLNLEDQPEEETHETEEGGHVLEFIPPKINIEPRQKQAEMDLGAAESASNRGRSRSADDEEDLPPMGGIYKIPPVDLLDAGDDDELEISEDELNANAQILEDRLMEFGVQGRVIEINPGPVITRYDVEPAAGVKISRIVALADDLALAMRARRIRIVAPIPGKGAVGIEIPNRKHSVVRLREIITSKEFRDSKSELTVALGKTISGEPFVTTLDRMPHLLIAGATGSGKSVCLNSIITSILYRAHPTRVQFVMVDPKRLELTIFNDLRHHHLTYKEDLDEEVVTSPDNAIALLKGMTQVMDQRYEILARAGVRNINDYNDKLARGDLKSLEHEDPYEPLPYLVLIVDELADLMLTSAREVEEPIARLAQMARAVGIHLIVATQRPSVNVITGVIKANFPARIAFQVASKTDSRTILDLNGAEKLLGMGDMLFIPQGSREPMRIHGAYVSADEIEKVIAHVRQQPRFPKRPLPPDEDAVMGSIDGSDVGGGSRDALFNEALKLIVRHQQGSISLIQRRLKVGYARAARLIDELEAAGVVGPYDGSKAREVLWSEEELEELDLN